MKSFDDLLNEKKDAIGHEHGSDGKFTSGSGGGSKSSPYKGAADKANSDRKEKAAKKAEPKKPFVRKSYQKYQDERKKREDKESQEKARASQGKKDDHEIAGKLQGMSKEQQAAVLKRLQSNESVSKSFDELLAEG